MAEAEANTAGFKDGGRGHEPGNVSSFQKLEKASNGFSLELLGEAQPDMLILGLLTFGTVR